MKRLSSKGVVRGLSSLGMLALSLTSHLASAQPVATEQPVTANPAVEPAAAVAQGPIPREQPAPTAVVPGSAPAPAPVPAPAPAPELSRAHPNYAALYGPSPTPDYDTSPSKPPELKGRAAPRDSRFVFVPRVGIGLAGAGDIEASEECSGSYAPCSGSGSDDFDDSSKVALGADVLFGVARGLRLGLGTLYVPNRSANDGDIKVGSDLSASLVAEAVIEASPSLSLALRGQAGGLLLFPGGDLQDDIDARKQNCATGASCEVGEGPFPGLTYGFGAGLITPLENVNLRLDVLYHAYAVDRLRQKETFASGTREEHQKVTGHQVWLLAGLEL